MSPDGRISARIREVRRRNGLTQIEFAERLGVPQKKISDVERGRTAPNPEFLLAVRNAMGVTIDWLLTGKGPEAVGEVEAAVSEDRGRIGKTLRELSDLLKAGGLDEYLAEEQAVYCPENQCWPMPVFEIGSGKQVPFEGGRPAHASKHVMMTPIVSDRSAFGCWLRDDTMSPEFGEGDMLIFGGRDDARNGDYACAHIEAGTLFRQVFFEDETIRLVPVNRRYPELRLNCNKVDALFRLLYKVTQY